MSGKVHVVHLCRLIRLSILMLSLGLIGACQIAPAVSIKKLQEHQELANLTGLKPTEILNDLHVSWAIPGRWDLMPIKKNPLYTHQQWRSPTLATGVGV